MLLLPAQVLTAPDRQSFEQRMLPITCGPTGSIFQTLADDYDEHIVAYSKSKTEILTVWVGQNTYSVILTTANRDYSCVLNVGTDFTTSDGELWNKNVL